MNKTLLSLALLCFGTSLRAEDAPAKPPVAPSIPRLDGIKLDGDLSDWENRGLRLPYLTPDSPRLPDPAHSKVSARFAWDETGLLIAVEVTDTTPSEADLAAAAYSADSIELFLTPDPAGKDHVQLVLSPGHDPAHPAPRSYVFDFQPVDPQDPSSGTEWAVKRVANGYVAEVRLPWAARAIKPAPGLIVGTRLFVNDDNGMGTKTRFAWQPEPGGPRYYGLTLAADSTSGVLDAPAAWTALDVADTTGRLNMIGSAALAGTSWQVRQGDQLLGVLALEATGDEARGSLALPAGRPSGSLTLTGPNNAQITVGDTLATDAVNTVARANDGSVSPANSHALAFARAQFSQHVFSGRRFPTLQFIDPARVERLLGAVPVITTRWLNPDGADVTSPNASGLYAARSEITLPARPKPLILENIFYRVPDGTALLTGLPPVLDEMTARLFAFGLQGSDATPTQSARVAERWWHKVRRSRGWSEALPYKIHVPEGASAEPRPLIVHLHGSGGQSEVAASKGLPQIVQLAGPEPIVVYPQTPTNWRGPAVAELIDKLAAEHRIDPKRIYLFGFSLGGIGSWEVALDQPERFAAVVPIGGYMGSPADAGRLKNVPVWVFNGENDPTTTVQAATLMVEALRKAGGKPQFTILPGKSHGDSQDAAYGYPDLFEWMLAQRRE